MWLLGIWIVVFRFGWNVYAQTLKVLGTVTHKTTREPLAGVLVTIRPAGESKYDGRTAMSREYMIRPRNVMAGVFFRF